LKGYWNDDDIVVKKIMYIFSFLNLLLKICLAISLYVNFRVEKKKIKFLKDVNHRKTVGGRLLGLPIYSNNSRSTNEHLYDSKKRISVGNFFHGKNLLNK